MKKLLLLIGIPLLFSGLFGQAITTEKSFGVNYPILSVGYPSKIVPNENGSFAYLEYWTDGQGRKFPNHYIQSYDKDYKEEWFLPLTKKGSVRLSNLIDVVRFNSTIAVIGYQFSPSIKRDHVKMQFFTLDGHEKGPLQVVSNYTKSAKKDYEDLFSYAPDRSHVFWLGHNPSAAYKKRSFYCSVFSVDGRKKWSKKLFLPHVTDDRYKVKQTAVDKRGNAYFLLTYELVTNSLKDTLNRPIIVRFDYKENKFTEQVLNFPNSSIQESRIEITERGELAFLGIVSDGSESGFLNGGKSFETALSWNKIAFQLFEIERELHLKTEYTMDFPEKWLRRYKERGANFSKSEVVERKGKLYWIMEEFYTQIHNGQEQHLYYDVATIAIDKEAGEIEWATTFEKKQRDYKSGRLLSYCLGMTGDKMQFVYLNQRGAQGKIICTTVNLTDGSTTHKTLARNETANYLFFPRRSSQVDENKMVLMGVGRPNGNSYKLIEVTFE